jgi:hypothetical protein
MMNKGSSREQAERVWEKTVREGKVQDLEKEMLKDL